MDHKRVEGLFSELGQRKTDEGMLSLVLETENKDREKEGRMFLKDTKGVVEKLAEK